MKISLYQPFSFIQQGGRPYQEDARFPDSDRPDKNSRFFLVCDGVGGSEHGELASRTVCEAFARKLQRFDFCQDFTNRDFSQTLDFAYDELDDLAKRVKGDMATTLTFLCFHENGCTMAHIGDSRIYQLRPGVGNIFKTDDHSLVNSMVRNGVIPPSQAEKHPQGNVITRCMQPAYGQEERCQATVFRTQDVKAGDYFFLCSDGVLKCISDDLLTAVWMDESMGDEEIIQKIACLSEDSDDNNTAMLLHVSEVTQDGLQQKIADLDSEGTTTTRRFDRVIDESMEIESHRQSGKTSLFAKLKQWFK